MKLIHFELLAEDELDATDFAYDGATEIVDSRLIEKLVSIGEIAPEDACKYQHVVIGFNSICSYLNIVFSGYKISEANKYVMPKPNLRSVSRRPIAIYMRFTPVWFGIRWR